MDLDLKDLSLAYSDILSTVCLWMLYAKYCYTLKFRHGGNVTLQIEGTDKMQQC